MWTQIEVVELTNDGSGLGFGISGNKSTGVVVKAIVPGSIADKVKSIRSSHFHIDFVVIYSDLSSWISLIDETKASREQ